eukprot:CAMPEP_0197449140 /NCGR_PEP_ID=MMETSP1175-20131217/20167_1 /TAXON_ID=1003142 /ORGANISM="Triceratium dubium, Strain CCMP147" /LENGTH=160 /DNA_ID=CAMNT_0042981165 /DNA_START=380 /DNA_END=862 /DNA_ORIENTATION=-
MTSEGPVCSDVYYKFQHEGSYAAVAIDVEGVDEAVVVSQNHLVYVGETFGDHKAIPAKDVRVGDMLVAKEGPKKVTAISETMSGLVNVLTAEPSLVLESGVLISAHSYSESLYGYTFMPFKIMYSMLGAATMGKLMDNADTKNALTKLDYYMGYGIDIIS